MVEEESFIGFYYRLAPEKRFDLMYKNYYAFPAMIENYESDLKDLIKDYRARAKRDMIGDLGVRIQSGGMYSDVVGNEATDNVEIIRCLTEGEYDSYLIKDIPEVKEIRRGISELGLMRLEFEKLNQKLRVLKPDEYTIIYSYMMKKCRASDLSDSLQIELGSTNNKIYRIKKKVYGLWSYSRNVFDDESILMRCS